MQSLGNLLLALPRQRQPQAPPQQPPPPVPLALAWPAPAARPPTATVESSRTVSSCPLGQVQGADDSLIGRVCSKVSPQARHRYSYLGTAQFYSQVLAGGIDRCGGG